MKKILISLLAIAVFPVIAMADCPTPTTATATVTLKRKIPGLLDGNFSVSADKKVHFAGGNLKYTKSTNKWEIMAHQYDKVETTGMTIGDDYASQDVITLFGWGTSGWDNTAADNTSVHYQPYSTCNTDHNTTNNNYQYGPSLANVAASESWSKEVAGNHPYENYDWGVFNSGDLGAGWRTLTKDEWAFLINQRENYAILRTYATVHGVTGLILLPDGWTVAASEVDALTMSMTNKSVTDGDWTILEKEGAVFLPAAGFRNGTSVNNVGADGGYWSSSAYSATFAYALYFLAGVVNPQGNHYRYRGFSVRLVQDVE